MTRSATLLRARNSEAKDARRCHILDSGFALFQNLGLEKISMDQIAKKAKLAKGTLYLYFKTKDEVFLALLRQELQKWILALKESLQTIDQPIHSKDFAQLLVASFERSPELPRLLSVLHTVLEHNISEATALEFKLELKNQMTEAALALVGKTPALKEENALSFLMKAYGILVGLYQVSNPNPMMKKILENPELALFQVDFEQQLTETLWMLLAGMEDVESQKNKTFHLFKNY